MHSTLAMKILKVLILLSLLVCALAKQECTDFLWRTVDTDGKWCNHPRLEGMVKPATPKACQNYCEKAKKRYCMWDYGLGDGFCMASDECSNQLMAGDRRTYKVWKKEDSCKLESLGCFNDKYDRALPELLLNERDITSARYNDRLIDWKNFKSYIKEFACRCAKAAAEKGYTVIGLQFYGECWSGPDGEKTYDKYGANHCIDGDFRTNEETDCGFYIGTQWTNHVYRIATPECSELFEPMGCFNDDLKKPRPLPHYIMNERDYRHESWNGRLIDWENWSAYSMGLICRCAANARKLKHTYFAIQFWGECWSGDDDGYARNGISENCRNEYFKECACNSYACVGKMATNYVYKLRNNNAKCDH